jgi:hypothetical protein
MKKKLLLVLTVLLALGVLFTACPTDDPEDDYPPPPVVIKGPPPKDPDPEPEPTAHAPSAQEMVGTWETAALIPEDGRLVTFINHMNQVVTTPTGTYYQQRTDEGYFGNQLVHAEYRITNMSIDEDLNLSLSVSYALTITRETQNPWASNTTWYNFINAKRAITNKWLPAVIPLAAITPVFNPTSDSPNTTTVQVITVTATENINKGALSWPDVEELTKNGIVSPDGKELRFKQSEIQLLYPRWAKMQALYPAFDIADEDYELVFTKKEEVTP